MDQAEKEIRQAPVIVRDEALNAYVKEVACKVVGDYCSDLRVYIVDAPVFNASMAPNGAMLVFTGALLRMQDESELALILGHEFAHFKQRHSLQMWEKAKSTTAVLATFGVITYAGGVGIIGSVAQLGGLAGLSNFSRDKERESDAIGFQIALSKGYDPKAGTRVWERMVREEKASKLPKPIPAFASHPKSAERLADVRAAADAAPAGDYARHEDAYEKAMRPFLEKWLEAELSRRMYDTSIQVIQDRWNGAPAADAGVYAFYLSEAYRRRNKGDDRAKASELLAESFRSGQAPAGAWREEGLSRMKAGDKTAAISALRTYLEKSPDASDKAFIQKYLSDLEKQP